MTLDLMIASDPAVLVSWYKPILIVLTFGPWAWLVATKLDKDAKFFYLNQRMWNGIHMTCGVVALIAMLLIPAGGASFWIGWPIGIIVLLTPILVYWKIRNQEVPENQKFALTSEGLAARMEARKQSKATRQALLTFVNAKGKGVDVPTAEDPAYAVHLAVEDLVSPALENRSSKVEILVSNQGVVTAQTIDGVRFKREPISPDVASKALDYIKNLAGLNLEDRRRRQTGTFLIKGPAGPVRATAITQGASGTLQMTVHFDRAERLLKPFDALGLLPSQIEALRPLLEPHERHGIVLLGGPPGHGLTTTGLSFIARHDAYTSNIKSVEREIEARIDGVDHVEWDPSNPDVDFATLLQSILRRDPDIVLISDVKESETAKVAAEPGMSGPLLYIQRPSATIGDQIRDWIKRVGDVKQAVRALRAVTNQRLMRKLCPNCRQPFTPSEAQLKKLNLPADSAKQLFRHNGKVQIKNKIEACPICNGTGYLGQTAAFEVMMIDDEVRKHLLAGDLKAARAQARRNKMIYLHEAAMSKVISGETSVDEVVRITAGKDGSSSPSPSPAPSAAAS